MRIVFNFTGPVTIEVTGPATIALPAGGSPTADKATPFASDTPSGNTVQRRALLDLLNDPNYRFRKIGTLAEAIGLDETDTEEILEAIGARQEQNNSELWGLVERVGEGQSY